MATARAVSHLQEHYPLQRERQAEEEQNLGQLRRARQLVPRAVARRHGVAPLGGLRSDLPSLHSLGRGGFAATQACAAAGAGALV